MEIIAPEKMYVVIRRNLCSGRVASTARAISLIKGELIKKAMEIPRGILAARNPIKTGMEEQEQNGVSIPMPTAAK